MRCKGSRERGTAAWMNVFVKPKPTQSLGQNIATRVCRDHLAGQIAPSPALAVVPWPACCWFYNVVSPSSRWADDVAPTSLNEGPGEGRGAVAGDRGRVSPGHETPPSGWMGQWWCKQKERVDQMWKGAKCGKSGRYHFGKGRETGFPAVCSSAENRSSCCAEDKPCCG